MRRSLFILLSSLGLLALGTFTAAPVRAACPGADRTIEIDPGFVETTISKLNLTFDLSGYFIVSSGAASHGILTELSDHYTYRPRSSFWTAGVDSFEIRLATSPSGRIVRSETVLLVPRIFRGVHSDEGLEGGLSPWPSGGATASLEVYTGAGVISGANSLRLHADSALGAGWLGVSLPDASGGQQGSGAQGTIRPPGGGGGSGRSAANPSRLVVLELGSGISQHRVRMQDDGTVVSLRLESPYGTSAWVPVSRAAHQVHLAQWISGGTDPSRTGALPGSFLFVDGALVARLTGTSPSTFVDPAAYALRTGTLEAEGPAIDVELDDLQLSDLSLQTAVTCRLHDGFEDGTPSSAWTWNPVGPLSVDAGAALDGVDGLAAALGTASGELLIAPSVLAGHPRLGLRLRLDPNSIAIGSGGRVTLLEARTAAGKRSLALLLDHDDSVYHLRLQVEEDGTDVPRSSPPVAIPNGPVALTLGWRRSPSQHEPLGNARLWVDGTIATEIARIGSYAQQPQTLKLGAVALTGAALGSVHLDTVLAVTSDRY